LPGHALDRQDEPTKRLSLEDFACQPPEKLGGAVDVFEVEVEGRIPRLGMDEDVPHDARLAEPARGKQKHVVPSNLPP
jgi:hypothetical protein